MTATADGRPPRPGELERAGQRGGPGARPARAAPGQRRRRDRPSASKSATPAGRRRPGAAERRRCPRGWLRQRQHRGGVRGRDPVDRLDAAGHPAGRDAGGDVHGAAAGSPATGPCPRRPARPASPRRGATHAVRIDAAPTVSLTLKTQDDRLAVDGETICEIAPVQPGAERHARRPARRSRCPRSLEVVGIEGPTRWQVRGQLVVFEPMAELRPRVDAIYRIRVRGVSAPDDGDPGRGPGRRHGEGPLAGCSAAVTWSPPRPSRAGRATGVESPHLPSLAPDYYTKRK